MRTQKSRTQYNGYNDHDNRKNLFAAIVLQAVEDYKLLQQMGADDAYICGEGRISKQGLEEFFLSDYCDSLLSYVKFTGEDILKILNK